MPLIVITGYPCSNKTKRAHELREYFEVKGKEVHIVSEREAIVNAGFSKNACYNDSRKENHVRAVLKSEVQRLISSTNVIIYDGSNYIKGYRYQLYCITKANHSTQCTLYTIIHKDRAMLFNSVTPLEEDTYELSTIEALVQRFEEPDGKNRWDAPLFLTGHDEQLDFDGIYNALFDTKPPPPNLATQNAPLSATNFLHDMNKIVKDITSHLISLVSKGCKDKVTVPQCDELEISLSSANVPQLLSLSRQFLSYSKLNTPQLENVPKLYVQFLKTKLELV